MDNTIADFQKAFGEQYSGDIKYPQSQYGFFRNLEPIRESVDIINDWFDEAYTVLDIWFLTRPSTMNLLCYTEKAEWIKNHFGYRGLEKLIICPDKSLLIGDYLIDDETNAGQTDFEGRHIHFGTDPSFINWGQVRSYFNDIWMRKERELNKNKVN